MGFPPPEPNLPGPSNGPMMVNTIIVFAVLCPLLVAIRLWTRLRSRGPGMGWDDWMIVFALLISFASGGAVIAGVQYGYGQHIANLTPSNKYEANRWFYTCQITYKWSISATKVSILLLYQRIFHNIRWLRTSCWVLIAITSTYLIAMTGTAIFQCTPIERAFDKSIPGTCINNTATWFTNSIFSVLTDFVILLLPLYPVYQLQVPRAHKIALSLVFCLGIFVVITACVRMTTLQLGTTTTDNTYNVGPTWWSLIEQNVAILCSCLPMCRVIIVAIFPRFLGTSGHRQQSSGRYATGTVGGSHFGHRSSVGHHTLNSFSGKDEESATWPSKDGSTVDTIQLNSVRRHSSEEHILRVKHDGMHSTLEHDVSGGTAPWGVEKGTIHKTVEYSVRVGAAA